MRAAAVTEGSDRPWSGLGWARRSGCWACAFDSFFFEREICVFDSLRKKEKEHVPTKERGHTAPARTKPDRDEPKSLRRAKPNHHSRIDGRSPRERGGAGGRRRRRDAEDAVSFSSCPIWFLSVPFFRYSRRAAGGREREPIRRVLQTRGLQLVTEYAAERGRRRH
jgi:hypothetical protein